MSRSRIEQQLTQVEEDVARGARHIARQREMIAELERDGHNTAAVRRGLETVAEARRQGMAERGRLQRELQSA